MTDEEMRNRIRTIEKLLQDTRRGHTRQVLLAERDALIYELGPTTETRPMKKGWAK